MIIEQHILMTFFIGILLNDLSRVCCDANIFGVVFLMMLREYYCELSLINLRVTLVFEPIKINHNYHVY
jgi:hypothetical protein